MTISLSLDITEYEGLVALARKGAAYDGLLKLAKNYPQYKGLISLAESGATVDSNDTREVESFLKMIEERNGITRHFLAIRWQEIGKPLQVGIKFPETWPPEMTAYIRQFTRPIARADVDALMASRAVNPQLVLVTEDPGLRLGWTELDDYFR